MRTRTGRRFLVFLLLAAAAWPVLGSAAEARPVTLATAGGKQPKAPPFATPGRAVVRVFYERVERVRDLMAFDLWEFADPERGYVLVAADAEELERIRTLGFRVELDVERTEDYRKRPTPDAFLGTGIPGYPCYRTVEETFATAEQIVAAHPTLASWNDVGDSWEKTNALGGYDLRVLVLTNSAVSGPKPKSVFTCAIHAREYATAELCTRFAETLIEGHDVDAEATWLLDHHEIHLMLVSNPDGRKQAETGEYWRKNTNQNFCNPTSVSRGVDLNRNFEFEWDCCGGASDSECDELYRGPSPASEPEVQVVQSYLSSVFPDQRAEPLSAPAPDDATGVYADIHASGRLVLWPWGFPGTSPNDTQLRTLGRKLAYFNGHTPKQAVELYPTDGTTVDYAYGELGIAAYVYELGTSFFQDCPYFENTLLPDNLQSLIYLAKSAREPYRTPAGPDARDLLASPAIVPAGSPVTLTGFLDDTRFENSAGTEPVQSVASAEAFVNVPPWNVAANPVPVAMTATDGAFDDAIEEVTVTLSTAGLAPGRHSVFVRGADADGNVGAVTAIFVFVEDGTEGSVAGTVTEAGTGLPLPADVLVPELGIATAVHPVDGAYSVAVPAGTWTFVATAPGHMSAQSEVTVGSGEDVNLDFVLALVPEILLVDDDDNAPDVRAAYTDALDQLGLDYSIWDTVNSDDEPGALDLLPYRTVIWFTGDEYGGSAGPGTAGESALATWLDSGRCLWIASQEYFYDRGLTGFMASRLGVASAQSDVDQTTVTGQGAVFGGLGPYTLDLPYSNYTDVVSPDGTAELAFSGSAGDAAVARDTLFSRTTFWGFGLEGLPTAAARRDATSAVVAWCDALETADADGDGVANAADCAPLDAATWGEPGPASEFRLSSDLLDNLTWSAPANPGSSNPTFDVLRGTAKDDFLAATCVAAGMSGNAATDDKVPTEGAPLYFLIRSRSACGGNLGQTSTGDDRAGASCP